MLKSLKIKNYKSCDDVVLKDINNINALIGKNGTGKTNILTAIQWAADIASSSNNVEWVSIGKGFDTEAEFVFDIEIDNQQYNYQIEVMYSIEEVINNNEVYSTPGASLNEHLYLCNSGEPDLLIERKGGEATVQGWDSHLELNKDVPCLRSILKLLPKIGIKHHIEKIVSFFDSVNYYPLDETESRGKKIDPISFIKHSEYTKWLSRHKSSSNPGLSVAMRLLYLHLEEEEGFNEVKELLGPNGLGLLKDINISFVTIPDTDEPEKEFSDKSEKLYFFQFAPLLGTNGAHAFNFYSLSFGTRRLIRMVVSLIYDKSKLFLIEQPEDGIHPGLLHKLIPLLRSYSDSAQFLIASHSPEILDRLEPNEVQLVTMVDGSTHSRSLSGEELDIVREYIIEEGAFSEYLELIQEY